jgi:hypothetical protein
MTACQGIVTAAPLNMEQRQPAFLRQDAGRHCGISDGPLLIGAGTDDGHQSAALIEIEACRMTMAEVYAGAVETVQGPMARGHRSATLPRRKASSRWRRITGYQPETLLYQLVAERCPRCRDRRAAEERSLASYVEAKFEPYLNCGRRSWTRWRPFERSRRARTLLGCPKPK